MLGATLPVYVCGPMLLCPLLLFAVQEFTSLSKFWSDCALMLYPHHVHTLDLTPRGVFSVQSCYLIYFFKTPPSTFLPSCPLPLVSLSWRHYRWSQRDRPSFGSLKHRLQLFWCQWLLSAPISPLLLYFPLLPRACPYSGRAHRLHTLHTGGDGSELADKCTGRPGFNLVVVLF